MTVPPGDEGRHPAGAGPLWEEAWWFDWVAAGGRLGGYVRLGLWPGRRTAWYWACVVGDGRDPVLVTDADVPLPAGRSLEVRADALWADHVCETPLDHWTVGAEAFAVALDDPVDAWGAALGLRVPFGLDLEWETDGPVRRDGGGPGYGVACRVSGEALVGDERIEVDGTGWREHSWGERDWWAAAGGRARGRLDDGTWFSAVLDGGWDGTALPTSGAVLAGDLALDVAPVAFAPVPLPAPAGGVAHLAPALCRFTDRAGGREGTGWAEWWRPGPQGPAA